MLSQKNLFLGLWSHEIVDYGREKIHMILR